MADYLFLFSIGPVQSFIAQARKTQDLYAGSQLLSKLIGDTMKEAEKKLDNGRFTPVFPAKTKESDQNAESTPSDEKKSASYPNRFFAKLQNVSQDEAAELGGKLEKFVRNTFQQIAQECYQEVYTNRNPPDEFTTQITRHLEVYWAAKPLPENYQEVYQQEYKNFEALFGATKNIRPFVPLSETGRKCSVCGERNVLFRGNRKDKKDKKDTMQWKPNWDLLTDEEKRRIKAYNEGIQKIHRPMPDNEGLCAVCFTKRWFEVREKPEFPSTTEIALFEQIPQQVMQEFKNRGEPCYRTPQLEPQLLYEENVTPRYLEKNFPNEDHTMIRELREKTLEKCQGELAKYYALLMFDVDKMGTWLSGDLLPAEQQRRLEEFHTEISTRLAEFGEKAREYVEFPKGKTVFAGGDDFLGFVNLSSLFDVLRELRWMFHKDVNLPLKKEFELINDITFSAGICIAHYKTPLGEVIGWAKRMEKEAKKDLKRGRGGRDAFGIAAMSHSGHVATTILKWGTMVDEQADLEEVGKKHEILAAIIKQVNDKEQESFKGNWLGNLDALATVVKFLQDETSLERGTEQEASSPTYGKISRACITGLDREFRPLLNEKGQLRIGTVTHDVVRAEIGRLVKRAKANKTPKEDAQLLTDCLYELYRNSDTFTNFLAALHIADVIKREAKYAH